MNKPIHHCCNFMQHFLDDVRMPILFSPVYKEYSIILLDQGKNKTDLLEREIIPHCPWCGTHLRTDLRDKWYEILTKEYQIDPDDEKQKKSIPQEFYSDEWWKKRGL
ncbi:MAG TPA: hypothetical protein VHX42_03960 [Candidatus Babeliales bacterium]|nr:hypothetical protein [Candidatus Babeliales bacterium]